MGISIGNIHKLFVRPQACIVLKAMKFVLSEEPLYVIVL